MPSENHLMTLPGRLQFDRRTVLAGAAGTAAWAALSPAPSVAAARRRPVIGVLTASLPGRPAVSRRGAEFVAGLQVAVAGVAKKVHHVEVVGGYSGLRQAAESLVKRGVNVLVAAVSEAQAPVLVEVCTRRKVALVMAGAGAQVAAPTRVAGRPTALHTSAQHWQSSLSAGAWAARHLGRTMHHVVAAPDAGFDSVFALRRGFTGAGGTVVGLSLTHEDGGVGAVATQVKATRPSIVAISASGARAAQIARALRAGGVKARFVLDPTTAGLGEYRGAADGAHLGGTHVHPGRHAEFARALRQRGAGAPTPASILGHDTGALIAAGVARLGARPWDRLPARLVGARVPGVRGDQKVDASGQVSVPLAVRKVRVVAGKRSIAAVTKRPRITGTAPSMAVVQGRLSSGYVNEYLTT